MAKNKNRVVNNCTVVRLNGKIGLKFAQYVINNWKDMPGFSGNSVSVDGYEGVFFIEAYPLIENFMRKNKIRFNESGNYIQYKEITNDRH